ncbi:MAG: CbbQ/NirQ/NorQ/GpvN family protein [Saprospiraceae bacterium]|mgnify:FL=1|jgi:nitric oxide reductase NorQ protein|nr:CbbQ/NirQ/NorQ/GpvN family protein [Saprospiraceae bacterium]
MKYNKEPFYQSIGQEIDIFERCYANRLPLLLKGPTGTGKSRFVEYMAYRLNKDLITITCHDETSSTDLIGRYILKGNETSWIDGPLTMAARSGAIIYLDEMAEARPDILVAIHSLTDFRRNIFIDKLGIEIQAHEDFMMVASFNPGYQKSMKELKPSTRQRFVALSFQYPSADLETKIIQTETGIQSPMAMKLVNISNKIRNLHELGLMETVSTRLIVDAAKLIHSGMNPRLAAKVAMLEPLTDELETIQSLEDLVNLAL